MTEEIAEWFLLKEEMTHSKLQRLRYYSYVWYLVKYNKTSDCLENRLFRAKIYGDVFGHTLAEIQQKYGKYGTEKIKSSKVHELTEEIIQLLEEVWEVYGELTAEELSNLSRSEFPWAESRIGLRPLDSSKIQLTDISIFEYYKPKLVTRKVVKIND